MANYLAPGDKTVYCNKCKHGNIIPFQQTAYKCPVCGNSSFIKFFGVVVDKDGNYIF